LRLALAQINATVGDLDGNRGKILDYLSQARAAGAGVVVFPELATTGYPPEDLLLRPSFVRAAQDSLEEIARESDGVVALVGTPWFDRDLANACAVCAGGRVQAIYRKQFLPNYGVFDEHRYFAEGRDLVLLRLGDTSIGTTICEDIWQPGPPATDLALAGAQLIVNLSASPFHVGKAEEREEMLVTRARDTSSYLAFCNLSAVRTSSSSTGTRSFSTTQARSSRAHPASRSTCFLSTSNRPRPSAGACATHAGASSSARGRRSRRSRSSSSSPSQSPPTGRGEPSCPSSPSSSRCGSR